MKVDRDGHNFFHLYQMFLKQKQIIILVTQEQNTIVKTAAVIMVIYLKMVQNLQEKDTVIMVFALHLKQKNNDY